MGSVFFTDVTLVREDCWVCGTPFALSKRFSDNARSKGTTFYCPTGCAIRYGKGEAEKLQEQLSAANARADQLREQRDREERRRLATKGAMTRLRKRINAGVCPHCSRSFKSLREHIAHMHPEAVKP
jgi:hypothetical protein